MDCPQKGRSQTQAGKKLISGTEQTKPDKLNSVAATLARIGYISAILLLVPLLCGCATFSRETLPPLPKNAVRPVVAVTEFDNESGFPGQWHLGRGMADLLVAELIAVDRFVVVDRRHLSDVIGEITRQSRDLFRKEGSVQKGRLKNAKYLVRGVITDFTQTGGSSAWFQNTSGGAGVSGSKALVMIALTVTDVETGEIVSCVRAGGSAKASSKWANFDYRKTAFGGEIFYRTPIGRATQEAINNAVIMLVRDIPIETWQPRVADVVGEIAVINGGLNVGLRVGDFFNVREEGRNILDPRTGDVIGVAQGRNIGAIRVIRVNETSADAMIVSGIAERGCRLESVQAP